MAGPPAGTGPTDQRDEQLAQATVRCADESTAIRQADIFRPVDDRSRLLAGIVVTGDCDLARGKAWGYFHWVPIVTAASYVASRITFDELESRCGIARTQLARRLNDNRTAARLPPFSEEAINDLIRSRDSTTQAELAAGSTRVTDLFAAITAAEIAVQASPRRDAEWDHFDRERVLNALRQVATATDQSVASLPEKCRSALKNPRGDIFLIPDLLPGDLHVAMLRFLSSAPLSEIGPTIGRARTEGARYYRFARMLAPFRYELTRRLGAIFSDIGLPSGYEDQRDRHILRLHDDWKENLR